ncbi:MAG: ATP-dependent DNA helicase RecQ [Bacteroidales bacterium]
MNIRQILLKNWGYPSFRPMQEDIINSVLSGKDTLALLPTGGGKSICYQVPGLAKEGVCIVISPLIALMKDQVENLKAKNIPAVAVYSGLNSKEIDIALDNCIYGNIKFLYISPERLTTKLMRARLQKMNVNLLAVDEAHCISQWGYDFRPPYLRIAEIREFIPNTPILALTATATKQVAEDIIQKLEFKDYSTFKSSFERKNLTYAVLKEEDKLKRLLKICKKIKGTGIIYVRSRKKTKEIALYLKKNRIAADYYHAGLDSITRHKKQENWMKEDPPLIVSTNAFGMGIDKPNVRFVVHIDMPDSPEAYFQEAGRAGRDGKQAYAVLLYNDADIVDAKLFWKSSYPEIKFIKQVYNSLGNYFQLAIGSGENISFDFELSNFCNTYKLNNLLTYNALKILENEGYILLSGALSNPSKMIILLNKEQIYRFQILNPVYEKILKTILRSYTGLFSEMVKIDENVIAKRLNLSKAEVTKALHQLNEMSVIKYEQQNVKPRLTFCIGRVDQKDFSLSPETYNDRMKYARFRIKAMEEYVTSTTKCRSQYLIEYFGEEEPPRCGTCDVCRQRNKVDLSKLEFDQILNWLKPILREQPVKVEDVMAKVANSNEEKKVMRVIKWLLDNKKIITDPDTRILKWNE